MSDIMSIPFHDPLDTEEKINEVVRIAYGFVSGGFHLEIILETTEHYHTITPHQGFRPIVLKHLISGFLNKNGVTMCLVQLLEDE